MTNKTCQERAYFLPGNITFVLALILQAVVPNVFTHWQCRNGENKCRRIEDRTFSLKIQFKAS